MVLVLVTGGAQDAGRHEVKDAATVREGIPAEYFLSMTESFSSPPGVLGKQARAASAAE